MRADGCVDAERSHEFEPKMADPSSGTSEQHSSEVSETLVSSNEFLKPHMQDSDGHTANSPEESLSPASVIFFKEALTYNSSNVNVIQFTKASSSLPAPVRYEFQIERTNKKTRSEYMLWSSAYGFI